MAAGMRLFAIRPIHLWAMRDILRCPLESLLAGIALFFTILLPGIGLLLPHALSSTVRNIFKAAPSIIVRKVNAVGWQPIPVDIAIKAANNVTGVTQATPRVWGIVNGPDGPLTAFGVQKNKDGTFFGIRPEFVPTRGQATLGPGITPSDNAIQLSGALEKRFDVLGKLPRHLGIVANDLVLLDMDDARQLLGVPEGYASDLAVEVFHREEETAILPDLSEAFPWPVRLTTQTEAMGMYTAGYGRCSAISILATLPAILSVCLLMVVNIRSFVNRKKDIAILKAAGWTTGDILRFLSYRVGLIGLPAAGLGMAGVYLLVFSPANQWIATLIFGWQSCPPMLNLMPQGALFVLLEVAAWVLLPYTASALIPALFGASKDVQALLTEAGA